MKRLVVLNYLPPTSDKIGAKRWRSFGQSLSTHRTVTYCCSDYDKVATRDEFDISWFSTKYPLILDKVPENIVDKVKYKLALRKTKNFSQGTPYDKALFDKSKIFKALDELGKVQKFDELVVSGAPFNLCYYATQYKKQNPDIKLVIDLRDPWTWGEGYGMSGLTSKQLNFELLKEKTCITEADLITVPSEAMKRHLDSVYPSFTDKIELLPHGVELPKGPINGEQNIDFLYGGTLYPETFDEIRYVFPKIGNKNVSMYCSNWQWVETLKSEMSLSTNVEFINKIKEAEFFIKLSQTKYYLVFFPERYKDFISSKFIEIVSRRVPIVLCSPKGLLSEYIENNKLGLHFSNSKAGMDALLKFINSNQPIDDYNSEYDFSRYLFSNLTDNLIQRIDKLG